MTRTRCGLKHWISYCVLFAAGEALIGGILEFIFTHA